VSLDILKLDALAASLEAYMDANKAVAECYAQCDTSPDYFCSYRIEARRDAAEEFGKRLAAFVDARIQERAAGEKGANPC
jgi:hypothetical protein